MEAMSVLSEDSIRLLTASILYCRFLPTVYSLSFAFSLSITAHNYLLS